MNRFKVIFEYLLLVEGGYFNHPNDTGGATKYGIIEREARAFGYKGNMRNLTLDFAENIYLKKYYNGNRLNEIKSGKIALSICDWIVNSGTWGSKKCQQALNNLGFKLVVDGKIGNKTLEALNKVNVDSFLKEYHSLQRKFYQNIASNRPSQKVFLKGWLNRVARKEKFIKENL